MVGLSVQPSSREGLVGLPPDTAWSWSHDRLQLCQPTPPPSSCRGFLVIREPSRRQTGRLSGAIRSIGRIIFQTLRNIREFSSLTVPSNSLLPFPFSLVSREINYLPAIATSNGEKCLDCAWIISGREGARKVRGRGKRIRRNVSVWLVTLKLEGMTEWSRYSPSYNI